MLKKNKTAAFLVIISILFPLFHQETAIIVRNGRKFASKNVLNINSNTYNSNIKFSKKNTRGNDIALCFDKLLFIISDSDVQDFSTDSLYFIPPSWKYFFWSKATFS